MENPKHTCITSHMQHFVKSQALTARHLTFPFPHSQIEILVKILMIVDVCEEALEMILLLVPLKNNQD